MLLFIITPLPIQKRFEKDLPSSELLSYDQQFHCRITSLGIKLDVRVTKATKYLKMSYELLHQYVKCIYVFTSLHAYNVLENDISSIIFSNVNNIFYFSSRNYSIPYRRPHTIYIVSQVIYELVCVCQGVAVVGGQTKRL